MGADEEFLDEETWRTWLEPREAIRRLIGPDMTDKEQVVSWLKGRLASGEIKAAGWDVPRDREGRSLNRTIRTYDERFWLLVQTIDWRDDFWISGTHRPAPKSFDLTAHRMAAPSFGYATDSVRFDRTGFARLARSLGIDADSQQLPRPLEAPDRAPPYKSERPPADKAILAKADEMRRKGLGTYAIAKGMRKEPGFEHVATRDVRALIKGRYPRTGRFGITKE